MPERAPTPEEFAEQVRTLRECPTPQRCLAHVWSRMAGARIGGRALRVDADQCCLACAIAVGVTRERAS